MAAPTNGVAEHLSARVEGSFAYKTVKDRLPVILIKVIDLLSRRAYDIASTYGAGTDEEIKQTIGRLSKLRNELQTNKDYVPLQDTFDDVEVWNKHLAHEVDLPRWFDGTWLFAECYFYRRIFEAFQVTTKLKSYDYFSEQKETALTSSLWAVNVLTDTLKGQSANVDLLSQLIEVSLWGNKCDLSLSAGEDSSQQVDPFAQLDHLRAKILRNDTSELVQYIRLKRKLKIDFVLDNAGFELVTDLVLMDYLTKQGFASKIRLFVKRLPWFVSDALAHDIRFVIEQLERSRVASTSELAKRCQGYLRSGQWSVEERMYWTLPFDYADMARRDPSLYADIGQSDLIVFKGDLNYRKLVGDRQWKPTTDFRASLMGFEPAPLVTLRTIKAETVTGLADGVEENMEEGWMVSGEMAVIQFVGHR